MKQWEPVNRVWVKNNEDMLWVTFDQTPRPDLSRIQTHRVVQGMIDTDPSGKLLGLVLYYRKDNNEK